MASTGWVNPGTMMHYEGSGDPWGNRDNAKTQNDVYASVSLGAGKFSDWLAAQNFSFGIPAGSTINGIEARIDRYSSTSGITDLNVTLHKSGAGSGDNKAKGPNWATSDTDTYQVYGGAADLWSTGYGYADVTNAGFGVMIVAQSIGATRIAYVDHMQIRITYTPLGYGHDVSQVTSANIGKVMQVPTANIGTVIQT